MSQFDVYINPSKKSREAYPYIIDIQNALISDITTRIVIPLGMLVPA
ncbi:CcdB family protein [Candidatus Colwellia aromaticivorans]|nr:CcdB family protein [Candidatus Colwellia aromaticivorans]